MNFFPSAWMNILIPPLAGLAKNLPICVNLRNLWKENLFLGVLGVLRITPKA